jgi:hypothetical protein
MIQWPSLTLLSSNVSFPFIGLRCTTSSSNVRKMQGSDIPGCNAMLLQMLKRNSSLWQVTANLGEDWTKADTAAMQFCAKRNKKIHAILTPSKNV